MWRFIKSILIPLFVFVLGLVCGGIAVTKFIYDRVKEYQYAPPDVRAASMIADWEKRLQPDEAQKEPMRYLARNTQEKLTPIEQQHHEGVTAVWNETNQGMLKLLRPEQVKKWKDNLWLMQDLFNIKLKESVPEVEGK